MWCRRYKSSRGGPPSVASPDGGARLKGSSPPRCPDSKYTFPSEGGRGNDFLGYGIGTPSEVMGVRDVDYTFADSVRHEIGEDDYGDPPGGRNQGPPLDM